MRPFGGKVNEILGMSFEKLVFSVQPLCPLCLCGEW